MVTVAAIAAVYAIFAAISHWFGSLISKVWVFFVSDQVHYSHLGLNFFLGTWVN